LVVVLGAQESAVVDGGLAAVVVFDDVVDVAVLGGDVAGGVLADAVADFDGSAPASGEEPVRAGHVDGLTGGPVDDPFEVGFEQELGDLEA
jgi:hypothetical protein